MLRAPFVHECGIVQPSWLSDAVPHLNNAYYMTLFQEASLALLAAIGIGASYTEATDNMFFIADAYIAYEQEAHLGDALQVVTTIMDADDKRIHLGNEMFRAGEARRICLQEALYVNVDLKTRRSAPWAGGAIAQIQAARAAHAHLPRPAKTGRVVGIRR